MTQLNTTKTSRQARKQRKALFDAALHTQQNMMHSQLSKALREKYGRRSVQVRSGDTVKVMRGQFKKQEGKVSRVDLKRGRVYIEGVELKKQDGSAVQYPVNPSSVQIQLLETSDKKRKAVLSRTVKAGNAKAE